MDYFKIVNIIAIGVQLGGVLVLALSDSLIRRIDAAYQSIPDNPFVEQFHAILEGKERVITQEEERYKRLESKADPRTALRTFRISLFLVAFGMLLQFVLAFAM